MTQLDCQSRNEASTSPEPSQTATMTLEVQNDVPAVCIPLTGEHLIEASAGTGKTWTLTGILLRLLIEAKRPPEQIIATTFTRAAAAEMRQRVHDRLIDFYQVLQWVSNLQDNPDFQEALYPKELQILPDDNENTEKRTASQKASHNNTRTKTKTDKKSKLLDPKARAELIEKRQNWLKEQAKLAGMSEKADDPINLHLVGFLLDHIATYPLADAIRRTELILTTLDKLFVGTLDSLAQKWLAEYSAETGYQKGMGITDDVQVVTDAIIHDELRRFQSQLYFNQPKIYQLLQQQDKLTTIDDHRGAVKKALTFISAPIDEVNVGNPFDFIELEALLDEFKALDLQDVEPYFDSDYRSNKGISAGTTLGKKLDLIPEIQLAVQQYGSNFLENLSNENMGLYDAIKKLFPNAEGKTTGFKTKNEENYEEFINLPTIKVLKAIHDQTDALDNYLNNIITNLNRNIAISVRDKLASRLEERNETTFTLQMVRLNQALSGRQGQKLARYIRHHYPVALIDESQDINGEQAQMIERIYLSSQATHNPTHEQLLSGVNPSASGTATDSSRNEKKINTFLLLVGDPKQAIYGFRGGDVANYNYMKAKFGDSIMTLNLNRRSNAQLIDALNHWFGCPEPLIDIGEADNHFELTAENKNSLSKF
ncbi:MAG: UvrD-helicase domain-containing protein, partial [Psychrobacter sp.]|nr:UvrD-helicase domain-containing protein [Psychrobacter sp.]